MYRDEPTTLEALRQRGFGRAFTRGVVTITVTHGPISSPSMGAGGLALHRDHDGREQLDTYTVTHVVSGQAAVSGIPSRTLARGVLAVLLDAYRHWDRPVSKLPARKLAPLCRRLKILVLAREEA